MLTLDKKTGTVTCDLPGLATMAQEHLDHAIEARTGSDVTRVIQKLFERHADLFAIRPQGGCYYVAERHTEFVNRVQGFLGRINGQLLRFPIQAGTAEGDRSVKEAVASGLAALIAEHRQAIESFGTDTRDDTLTRAAEKIRKTQFKVQAYAEYLAESGLPFAFASHFAPDFLHEALALYRRHFEPSKQLSESYAMVGVNVFAADTDAEAHRLFTSAQQYFLNLIRGTPSLLPPPVDSMDGRWSPVERAQVERMTRCSAVGSPATVKRWLEAFATETRADELIVTGHIHDHAARVHSFELVAEFTQAKTLQQPQ